MGDDLKTLNHSLSLRQFLPFSGALLPWNFSQIHTSTLNERDFQSPIVMLLLRRLSFLISSSSLRRHFLKPSLFPLPLSPHPRLLHASTRLSNGFFGKPNSRTHPVFCLKTNGLSYGPVHNDMLPRMIELNRKMQEVGVDIEFSIPGQYNGLLCPECCGGSSMEKSLSLFIEQDWSSACWCCFRGKCGWKGSTGSPAGSKPPTPHLNQVASKPKKIIREISEESLGLEPLNDEVLTYFAERLISKETLERNSIMQKRRNDGQVDIAFTYRRKGKLVSCKYWTVNEDFWKEKDTEKIFYGLDDIDRESVIIIVEGEMDKLAMAEAGFHNCVSVPDGAPPSVSLKKLPPEDQDIKYQYLWNCKEYMKKASPIILATDGDAPGKALAVELARRIGRERCWQVQWPMKNETEYFKDASEVLMFLGPDALKEVIDCAEVDPIPGLLNSKMQEAGINMEVSSPGQYNHLICPECNGGDSMEESFSLFIEQDWSFACWMCFQKKCGWKGSTGWLISKETLERDSVVQKRRFDNQREKREDQSEDIRMENGSTEENKSFSDGSISGYESLHRLLSANLKPQVFQEVSNLLLELNCGKTVQGIALHESAKALSSEHDFDIQAFQFSADREVMREPRIVRVGLIQNSIALPTTAPYRDQKRAIYQKLQPMIHAAGASGVNILCLQETWMMPFAFCTREKKWCELAEPVDGESTQFLQDLAKKYNMAIISPILERDVNHGETLWNTAVIIGNHGNIIGKHRKNHIPRIGDFNESTYYMEGNTGHPVFETAYGKIGVNICYGRHHPLNWLAFGLNGAEIVFNPSATVGQLSEPMWPIEARNAAIANSYFVGSINRVGTELFPSPFPLGDGKPQHADFGHFYGSSHFSAPDASCTPLLSRYRDGLMISDMDLNLCRQLKDKWGFQMTARYELYAELLAQYMKPDFQPQVITDPSLKKKSS